MEATKPPEKTYRKHFIPLESNPEVFTELIHALGVSPTLSFQDVYSLDDPELLAFIPRPVYALVLVFPCGDEYEEKVAKEEAGLDPYDEAGEEEKVVYWKQTIHNACGLYALLHGICNGAARDRLSAYPYLICFNIFIENRRWFHTHTYHRKQYLAPL
jgi:ubiquitin carboxyl-terminal hydrolase L3